LKVAKVSVCLQTYNHAAYIAQALDSVLMQKTDFDYEIILGEDESSDGTREICIDYAERHADRIRLFLRSRKDVIPIHGRATGRFNFIENLKAAQGKYLALLDGDDYWTDPYKLQKQADFLDEHPDYAICFHRVREWNETTGKIAGILPRSVRRSYRFVDLLHWNFIPTVSVMIRNKAIDEFPGWFYEIPVGDWPLFLLCAQHGEIGLINEVMAVYRVHSRGYWSNSASKQLEINLEIYDVLKECFGRQYYKQLQNGISLAYCRAALMSADTGDFAKARIFIWKSIARSSIYVGTRLLYKMGLIARLYVPFLWNRMRRK